MSLPAIHHMLPQFHIVNHRLVIGGYPSSVFALATRQVELGHRLSIAARLPRTFDYSGPIQLANLGNLDHQSHKQPHDFVFAALSYIRHCTQPGEIVHFHSGYAEYIIASTLAKLLFRRRRICHTLYCPNLDGPRGSMQKWLVRIASVAGVRLSSMSRHIGSTMPAQSAWTPPVIDSAYFQAGICFENRDGIMFVGNATPQKGLVDLLNALPLLAEAMKPNPMPVVTITTELARTNSSDDLDRALKRLADRSTCCTLKQLSIVDNMRGLLDSHAVHVAPFRSTIGPSDYFISTLEAMSMALVCVVSDLDGMAEIVLDGWNGFVFRAGDVSDLAVAIRRALAADRAEIGNRARSTVEELFCKQALRRTQDFYGGISG